MTAHKAAAPETLLHGLEAATEHVAFQIALAVGVPDHDVVVVWLDVVEVGRADAELEVSAVVEKSDLLQLRDRHRLVRNHVAIVHQTDDLVFVLNGVVHPGEDVRNYQRSVSVQQSLSQSRRELIPSDPGDRHCDEWICQTDHENLTDTPRYVAKDVHLQLVPGLVHDEFAQYDDQKGTQSEEHREDKEPGIAQRHPAVVWERKTDQKKNDGEQRRECHSVDKLVLAAQVTGQRLVEKTHPFLFLHGKYNTF